MGRNARRFRGENTGMPREATMHRGRDDTKRAQENKKRDERLRGEGAPLRKRAARRCFAILPRARMSSAT